MSVDKESLKLSIEKFHNEQYPEWSGYYVVNRDFNISPKGNDKVDLVLYNHFDNHFLFADIITDEDFSKLAFLENYLAKHHNRFFNNSDYLASLLKDNAITLSEKLDNGTISAKQFEIKHIKEELSKINPEGTKSLFILPKINYRDERFINQLSNITENQDVWSEQLGKTLTLCTFCFEPDFVYESLDYNYIENLDNLFLRIKRRLVLDQQVK